MTQAQPQSGARTAAVLQALIIAVAAACAGYLSHGDTLGDTAFSRLASAYSLVHHGTWVIGHDPDMPPNPCADFTVDKVEIDGKLYSTKPPLLPLMMAGEYWLAHHLLGWDLAERDDLRALLRVMVLTLVTLPYILALLCFAAMLRWLLPNPWLRVYLLFALAFGTQLIGFATHIDNHVPAAGMLMAALWCALGPATGHAPAHRWRFFGFGLAAGLVFTFDMPITIFIVPPGLYLLYRFPRYAFTWGALGVLAPLAVHFGVMLAVTGSPLPVQMRPELYLYEASYWRNPTGLDALCEPKSLYFFHMHVGRFGSFTLFPVLWFGIAGTLLAAFKRDTRCRGWVLAGLLAFLVLTLYYVLRTNNYGGAAYGFRWHIAAMPVLLLMGVPILRRVRRPWHWVVLLLLLAMSCYSAWECTRTPWGVHQEWTCRVFGTSY